ncbi:MAG: haloacid dehalogenase type II [Gammaproteobacteria bacterium]|nr:haloacid dehalogenase type II [Gammaproteobacteria bacterium]
MKLTDFKALTFDCYGTLIDWETGMVEGLKPLTSRVASPLSRDEILSAHARYESAQQAQTQGKLYRDILAIVYKRLAEEWGVAATHDECARYGNSVADWPAFSDSAEALAYLKSHYKLIILSNVDNASFEHSRARLGVEFDAVYTAEDIGKYKPALCCFDYLFDYLSALGIGKDDFLHVAESLFHDHAPANRCGIASCWLNRGHAREGFGAAMAPGKMPGYNFRFNSMADFAAAHREELKT